MKSHQKSSAIKHLSKDEKLKKVILQNGVLELSSSDDLYFSLLRSIVSQQLSVKAADTIWQRFLLLFEKQYPHPHILLQLSEQTMRSVGLSHQKAGYLRNIATFSIEKTLHYKKLKNMDDETLISYLTEIKGVGRWTVEMLLMFSLGRPDVFPKDDLGIQNGMRLLYNIKHKDKKKFSNAIQKVAEKWRPHRTLACLYIWQHKDNKPK